MASKKVDLQAWSKDLITNLGGKDNIKAVSHCITRLRLVLLDNSKANIKAIEDMPTVKGTFTAGGQFQIVIGPDVPKYYLAFSKIANIGKMSKDDVKQVAKTKMSRWQRALTWFAEIFIPIIPVLVAGGIILGFRNILETNWNTDPGTASNAAVTIPFFNGLNSFLWLPAQAAFWWLPVHIIWSIFKRTEGASPVIGIVIGLTMLVPPLINTYSVFFDGAVSGADSSPWIWEQVRELQAEGINPFFDGWDSFPWKIQYTAQVFPALGVGLAGAYINKYLANKVPGVVQQIVTPLVTILASMVLAFFIIGPALHITGSAVSFVFKEAFADVTAKFFVAPILGLIYAPLVVTGLHHAFNAVMLQNAAQNGGTFIFIILALSNIAQGGAVLGFMLRNRRDEKAKQVAVPAVVSAWLGVTEPALYGVNIRHAYPLIGGMVASSIASLLAVAAGVSAAGIGNGAWLGVLSVQVQSGVSGVTTWPGTGYTWFAIAAIIAACGSTGFTWLLGRAKWKWLKKMAIKVNVNS